MIKTNNGSVALASCAHVYANLADSVSDLELQKWSVQTRVISLRPGGIKGREKMLSKSQKLFYTKTLATPDGSFAEHVYAHTLGGRRKGDPHWGVNICDPNGDWKTIHLNELKTGGYSLADGAFNDSGGDFSYTQGGKPYKPPGYTQMIPVTDWRISIARLLEYWQNNDGHAVHCVNGLNPSSVSVYPPMIGMVENAFGSSSFLLPSATKWQSHARLVCDAQTRGWTPWVFCKMHSQDANLWNRWRGYMCATILLLDKGSLLFELGGMEGTTPPYINKEYGNKAYTPGIGLPLETQKDYLKYKQPNGTYVRKFERGSVMVDPVHQTYKVGV